MGRRNVNWMEMVRLSKRPPLRQVDLARLLGCRQGFISDLETGKLIPDLPLALLISVALGVRVEDIFFDLRDRAHLYISDRRIELAAAEESSSSAGDNATVSAVRESIVPRDDDVGTTIPPAS